MTSNWHTTSPQSNKVSLINSEPITSKSPQWAFSGGRNVRNSRLFWHAGRNSKLAPTIHIGFCSRASIGSILWQHKLNWKNKKGAGKQEPSLKSLRISEQQIASCVMLHANKQPYLQGRRLSILPQEPLSSQLAVLLEPAVRSMQLLQVALQKTSCTGPI